MKRWFGSHFSPISTTLESNFLLTLALGKQTQWQAFCTTMAAEKAKTLGKNHTPGEGIFLLLRKFPIWPFFSLNSTKISGWGATSHGIEP